MKAFRLHWLSCPDPEIVKGRDIADAMNCAGYGRGSLAALDYWEEIAAEVEP